MESVLPIKWPAMGLVEGWSFSEQPEGSAREYQNVRLQDCITGRLTGAQRAGLSKFCEDALLTPGTKVKDIIGFTVDNRQITYSQISSGSETVSWSTATPSKKNCLGVQVDSQGNVYALDGNSGVVKYNSDGEKIWQFTLPVADPNQIVRAFEIDELGHIYAGVSEGGDQEKARLWCFRQTPDDKTEQLWEINSGAFIEDMKIVNGRLFTGQNRPDRNKAYVRIYDFADTIEPELKKSWRIPYPVNSIAVKKDESVIIACEGNGDETNNRFFRSPDPKYTSYDPDSVVWDPTKLEDYKKRVWAWYIADDIDESDVADDLKEGVEIIRFRDRSGNNRHFYIDPNIATGASLPDRGPNLALDACLEHKGLRWSNAGSTSTFPWQTMTTAPNATANPEFADGQRTMVPTYTGAEWFVCMAIRPSRTIPYGSDTPRQVWAQNMQNSTGGTVRAHILYANAGDTAGSPSAVVGNMWWATGPGTIGSGGNGTGGFIDSYSFAPASSRPDIVIVSQLWAGTTASGSFFSIDGNPSKTDIFTGTSYNGSCQPSFLGYFRDFNAGFPTSGASPYLGDILEIIVIAPRDSLSPSDGVLTFDAIEATTGGGADQTNTEYAAVTGYLAHKYGCWSRLPGASAAHTHPYGYGGGGSPSATKDGTACPPNTAGTSISSVQGTLYKRFAVVAKYTPDGSPVWAINESTLDSLSNRTGGYGYAVAVNSDGNIYSMGPESFLSPTGNHQVRMLIDQGDTVSINTADGAWSANFDSNRDQDYHYPRIDVDQYDNLYIPYYETTATAASFRVYDKTGTVLHSDVLASPINATAVAVDPRTPDLRTDLDASFKTAEHMVVVGDASAEGEPTVAKVRLIADTQTAGSPRSLVILGVSGGDIVKFDSTGVTAVTDGAGALDSTARYVQSTTLFKTAYWTDGVTYKQFDPVDEVVSDYKCLSAGHMPARCALIETWRGRIVFARSADEPHNWFMSKKDEPGNFDYFPPTPTETDAVAGNSSSAGLCPDIINSVIPYSEDILVFGGDHSIWMLVGDPAAGGRMELVSDITGMAFGRPWCKDPNGVLYFIGSRGGLFRWTPGTQPQRISLYKIERQLQDIDFSAYYVRLVWNYQDEGIHIIQCPFGDGGTQVSHWFWEAKPDAFAKDIFGVASDTNVQPTAVHVVDGDTFDDRLLLFGCEDGFVRKWDKDATSDDTQTNGSTPQPIDAIVTMFPLQPDAESVTGMEMQFHGLTVVLGDRYDGCRYELFSSDEPDSFGIAKRQGSLAPGRNPPKWDRVSGAYCGLRLRNAAGHERFSYERGYIYATPAGQARVRMRN